MYISRGGTCMNKRIITINRMYGSNGRIIGKALLMKWELVFMTGN